MSKTQQMQLPFRKEHDFYEVEVFEEDLKDICSAILEAKGTKQSEIGEQLFLQLVVCIWYDNVFSPC